jgi:hypothetical protein
MLDLPALLFALLVFTLTLGALVYAWLRPRG